MVLLVCDGGAVFAVSNDGETVEKFDVTDQFVAVWRELPEDWWNNREQ